MIILGFETSCDETAAALVNTSTKTILAEKVYSQYNEHREYGGVVPEIASRAHLERLPILVDALFKNAGITLKDVDAIAATTGPGLVGALLMGATYAKTLALAINKPFLPINHLAGHALSPLLTEERLNFPYLLLQISGGHCQFEWVESPTCSQTLGATIDDAVGECFDKVGKMLGLEHPYGPALERLAEEGNDTAFSLPIPQTPKPGDFSFSGLKTHMRKLISKHDNYANLAASFQHTVATYLAQQTEKMIKQQTAHAVVIAGGVAGNKTIRGHLRKVCEASGATLYAPPLKYCTDNATMIAWAAGLIYAKENWPQNSMNSLVRPRWPLAELYTDGV